MSNQRSPGAFCSLVVSTLGATSDSVASQSTTALGNGAEVYCTANGGAYRFNSSFTGPATQTPAFVLPLSGTGTWVLQTPYIEVPDYYTGTINFVTTLGAPASNTWIALPSTAAAYSVQTSSTLWTFNSTSGQFTYVGPSGQCRFQVTSSVSFSDATSQVWDYTIQANGALVGTTTDDFSSVQSTAPGSTGIFTHQLIMQPNNGDVFQHVVRCTAAVPVSPGFKRYNVIITRV